MLFQDLKKYLNNYNKKHKSIKEKKNSCLYHFSADIDKNVLSMDF